MECTTNAIFFTTEYQKLYTPINDKPCIPLKGAYIIIEGDILDGDFLFELLYIIPDIHIFFTHQTKLFALKE